MAEQLVLPHKLTLDQRERLTVTGVREVVSFDDAAVVLHTELGTLSVQGEGLHLKALSVDGGQAAVEGHIEAMIYEQQRTGGGFFRRFLG